MTTRDVGRHHRHLLELASLLATAGLADAFADVFGARRHGASVLIGLGVALIAGTVGHHIWLRRTDHAPPAPAAPAAASPSTGTAASEPGAAELAAEHVTAESESAAFAGPGPDRATGVFWRVRTRIDNTPGRLAVLAGALAAAGANIQALEAHPAPTGVIDEFLVETSQGTTAEQLRAAVRAVGGRETTARPADVLALLDAPTRALELAARLVRRPGSLEAVLADLLDGRGVTVTGTATAATATGVMAGDRAGSAAPEVGINGSTLMLRRADGSTLTATRPGLPFTATELSRARALVELADISEIAELAEGAGPPASRVGAGRPATLAG